MNNEYLSQTISITEIQSPQRIWSQDCFQDANPNFGYEAFLTGLRRSNQVQNSNLTSCSKSCRKLPRHQGYVSTRSIQVTRQTKLHTKNDSLTTAAGHDDPDCLRAHHSGIPYKLHNGIFLCAYLLRHAYIHPHMYLLSIHYPSVHLSIYPSVHPFILLSVHLSVCLSVCLPIYLSIYLVSIYLSIYLHVSIYLPTYLSVYLAI